MRLREIVPRKLKLGDQVFYTHQASTSDARDLPNGRFPSSVFGYYSLDDFKPPSRFKGRFAERARWVVVWPVTGYGVVTGLTTRSEGVITPGYEDEQGYLGEHERYPLYEVKTALRGRPLLVPPWACVPVNWFGESFIAAFDEVPWSVNSDAPSWDEYVDVFLRTRPEKVTHA